MAYKIAKMEIGSRWTDPKNIQKHCGTDTKKFSETKKTKEGWRDGILKSWYEMDELA